MIEESRLTGMVKWFDNKKGFGFITHPEGDVFVHFSEVRMEGYRTLSSGMRVSYRWAKTQRGAAALEVLILEPLASKPSRT